MIPLLEYPGARHLRVWARARRDVRRTGFLFGKRLRAPWRVATIPHRVRRVLQGGVRDLDRFACSLVPRARDRSTSPNPTRESAPAKHAGAKVRQLARRELRSK